MRFIDVFAFIIMPLLVLGAMGALALWSKHVAKHDL
jgi:hypothetical protein